MKNVDSLLKAELEKLGVPVERLKYGGKAACFIVYQLVVGRDTFFSDDEEGAQEFTYQVHVYSKTDYIDILQRLKTALKAAGFYAITIDAETYEQVLTATKRPIPQSASARRRRAERTSTFGFTRSNSRSPMKTTPRRATVSNLLRRRSSDSLSSVPTDCGRLNTSQSLRTAWRRLGSLPFVSLTTRAVNRISKGGTAGSLKRLPALFCYERN